MKTQHRIITIHEKCLTHTCMKELINKTANLSDEIEVISAKTLKISQKTTIEEHLTEVLLPFASTVSMEAEMEWEQAWEFFWNRI